MGWDGSGGTHSRAKDPTVILSKHPETELELSNVILNLKK